MSLKSIVRRALPDALAEPARAWLADRRDLEALAVYRAAPTVPPPHAVKAAIVLEHAARFGTRVLIETGTYEGEMARKCAPAFARVITLELDPELAARATKRLARYANVRVVAGDSATQLAPVLADVREPALFWLDGHFSGAGTARGERDTPLAEELAVIARHGVRGHVVLVDDARLLGQGDYPDLATLERALRAIEPAGRLSLAEDIVRFLPPRAA